MELSCWRRDYQMALTNRQETGCYARAVEDPAWKKLRLNTDNEGPFNLTVLVPRDRQGERMEWDKAHKQRCRLKKILVRACIVEVERDWLTKVPFEWIWAYCECERPYGCKCGAFQRDHVLRVMRRTHDRHLKSVGED
jgi:hypothetical protein